TQALLKLLVGERYKNITRETEGILKGEYGATPAPVNEELQARVLQGEKPLTCRPADKLAPEFDRLKEELLSKQESESLQFGECIDDDVLTYALFPKPGLHFLANRNNPDAFEPLPEVATGQDTASPTPASAHGPEVYTVEVEGKQFVVKVSPGGDISSEPAPANTAPMAPTASGGGTPISAPLSG
ncbi:MAG: oxaloacetate decarboxylase, partial [Pseudomonadales bacterium]|nr:oxaloacetate decarboxylase [Pseudomonadales bacterium]